MWVAMVPQGCSRIVLKDVEDGDHIYIYIYIYIYMVPITAGHLLILINV